MNRNQTLCLVLQQFCDDDDERNPIILLVIHQLTKQAFRRKQIQRLVLGDREVHYRPSLYSEHWVFRGGFEPVDVIKMQQLSLYYLAYQIPLCEIGDKFDVAYTSTVLNCVELWIDNLIQLAQKLIKWPSIREREGVEQRFRALAGLPGVIGALDGCHINILAPADQQRCYQNRYTAHSIILQGICTADCMFTNVFVGFPGSANDSRVLSNSELYTKIEEHGEALFFEPSEHLLGDKIYPLKKWIMPPFKDYGHMTAAEKNYNKIHSKTRVKVENCFGLLKGRWRRLKYIQVYKVEKASKIVMACCLLHNFCLINNDLAELLAVNENEIWRVNVIQNARQNDDRGAAIRKRNNIVRMLQ